MCYLSEISRLELYHKYTTSARQLVVKPDLAFVKKRDATDGSLQVEV
jgi:hypothetical protein